MEKWQIYKAFGDVLEENLIDHGTDAYEIWYKRWNEIKERLLSMCDEGSKQEQEMTLQEFQYKIESIRVKNNWTIELECRGIWIIKVYNHETEKLLARTGSTSLYGIIDALEKPFDKCPWV